MAASSRRIGPELSASPHRHTSARDLQDKGCFFSQGSPQIIVPSPVHRLTVTPQQGTYKTRAVSSRREAPRSSFPLPCILSKGPARQGLYILAWKPPDHRSLSRAFTASVPYPVVRGKLLKANHAAKLTDADKPLGKDTFVCRRAYTHYLSNVYKEGGSSWFTLVELFQPHYGNAIADYILRTHGSTVPLNIYEIGGGTGTCARNILDYMKIHAPRAVYDTMRYTSVEISGALARKQYEKVAQEDSRRNQYRVECRNASDRFGRGAVDRGLCIVIMLEVLDNLPHDLVYRQTPECPWMEMRVCETDYSGKHTSQFEIPSPLQDGLIRRCLFAMKDGPAPGTSLFKSFKDRLLKVMNVPELVWVPTGCLQLLETLHSARPNMVLIASDFSSLPDVRIAGEGVPLVASKLGGQTKDHTTYLEAKGYADIFFPTAFSILRKLDLSCAAARGVNNSRHTSILTTAEFMDIFANTEKTLTRDGYNPLLEDFKNTRFYLSTPLRQGQLKH